MSREPPERFTVSIPPADELDLDVVDELVERGPWSSRSELIRELIRGADAEQIDEPDELDDALE